MALSSACMMAGFVIAQYELILGFASVLIRDLIRDASFSRMDI